MPSKKHSSLGRGLEALLAGAREKEENGQTKDTAAPPIYESLLELPLTSLKAGKYQPRRDMNPVELETLADSIRAHGILQPVVVRLLKEPGCYEIIAGERRFRAAALAGLDKIPVIIKNVTDVEAMYLALIENMQREDLSPIEEALGLERLTKEFGLTHIQIAESIGKSRTTVTNLLRLLSLTDDVKLLLERKEIEVGHAKILLTLKSQTQSQVAQQIVSKGLSVRETEKLITKIMEDQLLPSSRAPLNPDVRRLQDSLSEKLGAAVQIQQGSQGKGKLVIQYNSLEELDGILEHIK